MTRIAFTVVGVVVVMGGSKAIARLDRVTGVSVLAVLLLLAVSMLVPWRAVWRGLRRGKD